MTNALTTFPRGSHGANISFSPLPELGPDSAALATSLDELRVASQPTERGGKKQKRVN